MSWLYNTGGWNKTHDQIEQTPRVVSFELARFYGRGINCGRKWIEAVHESDSCILYPPDTPPVHIALDHKPNGYGGQQTFFLCPWCGERVRYLYLYGWTFQCRKCARLNYRSQQETRDCMTYYYKGMALARRHLAVNEDFLPDGFTFDHYHPGKPKGMHQTTYYHYLARFMKYRKKHTTRMLADFARIMRR